MPPKAQCGNPLWLSWMEELRDSAREKGIKSAEAYGKACRSLAVCPITYTRPRELTALVGIGDKTAQMLEVRWAGYCKENGLPLPGEISPAPKKGKGKAKAKSTAASDADGILHDSDSEDGENSEAQEPVGKKRKAAPKKPPKQYIPQRGSGGYGILLALILAIDRPLNTTTVYQTKSEIIRVAKEYSDSSYEHSEKGTYFTAWSGMKTMVNRGLVYMTGNPHKFCLTEEGYEVAMALRKLRPEFAHLEAHPFKHDHLDDGAPEAPRASVIVPETIRPVRAAPRQSNESQASSSRPSKFYFWYIDSSGKRVEELSSAMIRLDHNDFINLRKIEFLASQKSHPFASQLRLVDHTPEHRMYSEASLYGYVVEEGAPPTCSKFPDVPQPAHLPSPIRDESPRTLKRPREALPPSSDGFDGIEDVLHVPSKARVGRSTFARTASAPGGPLGSVKLAADVAMRRLQGEGKTDPLSRSSSGTDLLSKHRSGPRLSSHIPTAAPLMEIDDTEHDSTNIPDFDPDKSIIFPAGSYDVVLVLDTREIEAKSSRDNFSEAIRAKGINVETRALRLGDILWIAKRRDGLGGEEDECVLDYVVERKRLDDLCHSIKDGRYTEQCFRLSNSCINHVYYIVEDWDVSNRMQYDGKQIMTAKSQIQVHNRFFLKETTKLSQTIDFLITMTKVIQTQLASKDLHVIPSRYLSRSSYSALQSHLRRSQKAITYHTSFEAYQELNDKNASRTLKVAFGRMLMSVKGMSAERVSAMLDIWETPRDIWEALKIRNAEEESQNLDTDKGVSGKGVKKGKVRGPELFFADMIQGEGRRKIGDALSKELYRVFMGSATESQ